MVPLISHAARLRWCALGLCGLALGCDSPDREDPGPPRFAEADGPPQQPAVEVLPVVAPAAAPPTRPDEGARGDEAIEEAIRVIEDTDAAFLVPQADEPPARYLPLEFARMIRSKSKWLAADIHELEPWLDAVATRTFKSGRVYQVEPPGESPRDLAPWLRKRLQEKREKRENQASP